MKCFTKSAFLTGTTALLLSCVTKSAAQIASAPANYAPAAPDTAICPLLFENGAISDKLFVPQSASQSDQQHTAGSVTAVQPFGWSQRAWDAPDSSGTTPVGKTASAASLADIKIVSADLPAASEQMSNYLASRGWESTGSGQPLSLDQPATPSKSSVKANGQINFNMVGPLVQTAPKNDNPAQQIEDMSTRAWPTIAGWHPGESAFPNGRTQEADFKLASFAF
jgi:hypothetical protein